MRAENKPILCLDKQEEIHYCPDDSVYAFSCYTQDKKQEVLYIFNASSECRTCQIPLKDALGRMEGPELENLLLPGQKTRMKRSLCRNSSKPFRKSSRGAERSAGPTATRLSTRSSSAGIAAASTVGRYGTLQMNTDAWFSNVTASSKRLRSARLQR